MKESEKVPEPSEVVVDQRMEREVIGVGLLFIDGEV